MDQAGRDILSARLERAAVFALLLVAALAAFHEIASPWVWGHNGYNGAAFSQAARNTLRFGEIGQAQYWTAPHAPPVDAIYTHHPLLLNLHVATAFAVLGEHPWAARLVPAMYSVLGAFMLFVVARRFWGRATAVVALALFVLMPINLIFANMVDHEQGSIFWCLLMVYAYLRRHERASESAHDGSLPRWNAVLALSTTAACQFDWPPYYLAFFLFLHAVVGGVRRARRGALLGPELRFALWFAPLVLANFFGYMGWIQHRRSGLGDMSGSFLARTGTPSALFTRLVERLLDMVPWVVLLLAVGWTVGFLWRLGRAEYRLRDLVPVGFLVTQLVHQSVFKMAGFIHVYWYYHATPYFALAAAAALVYGARRVWEAAVGLERVALRRLVRVSLVGVLCLLCLATSWRGFERMAWGRATGGSPYSHEGHSDYDTGYVARWLAQRTSRQEAIVFDRGFAFRAEVLWYLDRVFKHSSVAPEHTPEVLGYPVAWYVVSLGHTTPRLVYDALRKGYTATLLDRQTIAFDLRDRSGALSAQHLVEQSSSVAWTYFVSPWIPPLIWEDDPVGLQRLQALRGVRP